MIRINNIIVQQIEGILTYNITRKEEGNTGHFRCLFKEKVQPLDIVTIEDEDETFQFLVHQATRIQSSPEVIHYDIMLKDTIHIFDKMYIPDRRFTTLGGLSAKDILDVYAVDSQSNIIFEYEPNVLLDLLMPEKEYAGVNFTTILKDIARRIGCRAYVELRGADVPLIKFTRLSQRIGATAIDYTANHYQVSLSAENYATEVLGKVKNAVVEDGRGTWFPSKTGAITPRTDEFRFDEASAAYILNDKIWAIIKVVIPDGIVYFETPESQIPLYDDLDLTFNVVPSPLFNQLEDTVDANFVSPIERKQANVIRYDIAGDRLFGLWATHPSLLTDRNHLNNAVNSAAERWRNEFGDGDLNYTNLIEDLPIRIQYVSQRDLDYMVEKMNVTNKYQSTLLSNQLSTLVELNQHANGLSLLAERLANDEIVFQENVTRGDKALYRLGNWTSDNKLITTIKREIDGDEVNQHVELSEKFANIDVPSQVSRQPYPFSVRNDVDITTNLMTKEYIEFSQTKKDVSSYMTSEAQLIATNLLNYNALYNKPIHDCEVEPITPRFTIGDYVGKAIHSPIMTFGQNTIVLHQQFTHPTIAGYTITESGSQRIRGFVSYVNEADDPNPRFLEFYKIRFGTESPFTDSGATRLYPLVNENAGLIDIPFVEANLDENCKLAHTHNIGIVTDSPKIILNGNFGFYNNLIRELDNPALEVYVSQGIFDLFSTSDKKIRPNDVVYALGTITYNTTTRQLSVTHPNAVDNIAIVLNGDIILALNGIDTCYINFIKQRETRRFIYNYIEGSVVATIGSFSASATYQYLKLYKSTANGTIGLFNASAVGDYGSRIWPSNAEETIGTFTADVTGDYSFKLYQGNIDSTIGTFSATVNYNYLELYVNTVVAMLGEFSAEVNGDYSNKIYDGNVLAQLGTFSGELNYTFIVNYVGNVVATLGTFSANVDGDYNSRTWLSESVGVLGDLSASVIGDYSNRIYTNNEVTSILGDFTANVVGAYSTKLYLGEAEAILGTFDPSATYTYLQPTYDYLGTTTQPFDTSYTYAVEGADAGACPSVAQVTTWLNSNHAPETQPLGNVIRVQTVVVDSGGFPVASCDTHYFEVILA